MAKILRLGILLAGLCLPLLSWAQLLPEANSPENKVSPIPPDTRVLQESTWKKYKVKLLMNPSQPYLRGPVDFYIETRHEVMNHPFPGSISIGFERASPLGFPLQETLIAPDDYIQEGLAKISYHFDQAGQYVVLASFTDNEGDFFALRGEVQIAEEGFWVDHQKKILMASGALLILLFSFACWKKNKKNGKDSHGLQSRHS